MPLPSVTVKLAIPALVPSLALSEKLPRGAEGMVKGQPANPPTGLEVSMENVTQGGAFTDCPLNRNDMGVSGAKFEPLTRTVLPVGPEAGLRETNGITVNLLDALFVPSLTVTV
jgi:hypothetical protein